MLEDLSTLIQKALPLLLLFISDPHWGAVVSAVTSALPTPGGVSVFSSGPPVSSHLHAEVN